MRTPVQLISEALMKTILCYGDSNTWGWNVESYNPATDIKVRYPRHIRWPGRLQKLLGDEFYVIEEGLNGRTTHLDLPDPPDRNGKNYLMPCLYSHAPIDLVILFLGGNDLKSIFNRSAKEIAEGLSELIQLIQSSQYGPDMQSPPQILLIGYPALSKDHMAVMGNDDELLRHVIEKSNRFDFYFSPLAAQYHCHYLNMSPYIRYSDIDGVHFDKKAHEICSDLIAVEIKKYFKTGF